MSAVAHVSPAIAGAHGERTLTRLHHEPLPRHELYDVIAVIQASPQKASTEGHPGTDLQWWRAQPPSGIDVSVPLRGIPGLGGICGNSGSGNPNVDLSLNINHDGVPIFQS